jgi:hypothetical protein
LDIATKLVSICEPYKLCKTQHMTLTLGFSFWGLTHPRAKYAPIPASYSSDALQEIESFFKRSHKVIIALTVQEILDEHIAKKLV